MLTRISLRFVGFSALISSGLAAVACTADGVSDPFTEVEASTTEPPPNAPLPPPSDDDDEDASPTDAGANVDAAKKKGKDASNDADASVWAPEPGESCPGVNQIIKRTCGLCGSQEAVCLLDLDGGPSGVVSPYSPCTNEVDGGCVPGTTSTESCGNCGTRTIVCNKFCGWQAGACQNEPPNSCVPTAHDYTAAGCVDEGTFRERECTNACTWTSYALTCDALDFELVVSSTAKAEVSGIFPLKASLVDKRITGSCPSASLSTTTNHPYAYVELVNPSDKTLTVSVWNAQATSTGPIIDTVMAAYAGNVRPSTDQERKACSKGVGDICPSGLPCGSTQWAGLTGTSAVRVPAFGSALVWFGSYYAAGGASTAEGDVKLVVRTDAVE